MNRVEQLEQQGLRFRVEGAELVITWDNGAILPDLIDELKANKEIIKVYISWRTEFLEACMRTEASEPEKERCRELAKEVALGETRIACGKAAGVQGSVFVRCIDEYTRFLDSS